MNKRRVCPERPYRRLCAHRQRVGWRDLRRCGVSKAQPFLLFLPPPSSEPEAQAHIVTLSCFLLSSSPPRPLATLHRLVSDANTRLARARHGPEEQHPLSVRQPATDRPNGLLELGRDRLGCTSNRMADCGGLRSCGTFLMRRILTGGAHPHRGRLSSSQSSMSASIARKSSVRPCIMLLPTLQTANGRHYTNRGEQRQMCVNPRHRHHYITQVSLIHADP